MYAMTRSEFMLSLLLSLAIIITINYALAQQGHPWSEIVLPQGKWAGLDADLLDGADSSVYLDSKWNYSGSDIYNINTGNVGIGTVYPEAKLHVEAENVEIRLTDKGDFVWGLSTLGTGDTRRFSIRDVSGNSELFTVMQNGNIGIGTDSPGDFRLYVSGKIRADTPSLSDPNDTVATKGYVDGQVLSYQSSGEKPVFVKCQVKHSSYAVYPTCPFGWHGIHYYAMGPVTAGQAQPPASITGVATGIDTMNTYDSSWWYMPGWTEDPPGSGYYKKQSTLSCTVCEKD